MFENFKNRMDQRGETTSDMLRKQSNLVIEQTWERDPNFRRVYVVKVDKGLPKVTWRMQQFDVKFNIKTYQSITSDEVAYLLQFRHGAESRHPEIAIGSYVYMEDEDGNWKWWMLVHFDERPMFRQWSILECNHIFKWVANGKIYNCLGVHRIQQSYNSGSWDGRSFTFVDDITAAWLPSNSDTYTIGYNQRFIISDPNYYPPLTWTVSKLENVQPLGLTKLKFTQETFDPIHDNAELGLANYFDSPIEPTPSGDDIKPQNVYIKYNGDKPSIKVSGSYKVFTAMFQSVGTTIDRWYITEDIRDITTDTNYSIIFNGNTVKIKANRNYDLVGKVIKVRVVGSDGSEDEIEVEVIA